MKSGISYPAQNMQIKYSSFYVYDEIESFLKKAQETYPDLMKLDVLAVTPEGRNIYAAEITDRSCGKAKDKSAYFIQACVQIGRASCRERV